MTGERGMKPLKTSLAEFLPYWERRVHSRPDGCWEWKGSKVREYGHFSVRRHGRIHTFIAHRFAYKVFVGDVEDGMHVHHTCKNPSCVNPLHLAAVTPMEHMRLSRVPAWISHLEGRCTKGHPFTPENLIPRKDGKAYCRQCRNDRNRAKRQEAKSSSSTTSGK